MNERERLERFESIYSMYADIVYRACLLFVKDKTCAEKLATRTFVDAYKHMDELGEQRILSYLVCHAKDLAEEYQPE